MEMKASASTVAPTIFEVPDAELLQTWVRHQRQSDFTEIVRRHLDSAICDLPKSDRELIHLRYSDRLPFSEVARHTGRNKGALQQEERQRRAVNNARQCGLAWFVFQSDSGPIQRGNGRGIETGFRNFCTGESRYSERLLPSTDRREHCHGSRDLRLR
jgi:hypothetical protein